MESSEMREEFNTGLTKIRHEIKSRLVHHGLYGTVTEVDTQTEQVLAGSTIEIVVKGRSAARSFDRKQIESCFLRVGGPVLLGIIAMVDELAAERPRSE